MFELSTKTYYGVAALIDLANNYQKERIRIKDIVENRSISQSYLEQIFNRLSKTGVIKSIRGNKGGYELVKPPKEITLFEIIEVLEGPLNLATDKCITALVPICQNLEKEIKESLSQTLYEIAEKEKESINSFIYYI